MSSLWIVDLERVLKGKHPPAKQKHARIRREEKSVRYSRVFANHQFCDILSFSSSCAPGALWACGTSDLFAPTQRKEKKSAAAQAPIPPLNPSSNQHCLFATMAAASFLSVHQAGYAQSRPSECAFCLLLLHRLRSRILHGFLLVSTFWSILPASLRGDSPDSAASSWETKKFRTILSQSCNLTILCATKGWYLASKVHPWSARIKHSGDILTSKDPADWNPPLIWSEHESLILRPQSTLTLHMADMKDGDQFMMQGGGAVEVKANNVNDSGVGQGSGVGASSKKKSRSSKDAAAIKRRCVSTACIACRRRKSKCDGNMPSCAACSSVYGTGKSM